MGSAFDVPSTGGFVENIEQRVRFVGSGTSAGGQDMMAAYLRAVPVLQVANVEISVRWYGEVLGFAADPFPRNPPYSFAMLRRDGAEIVAQCADEQHAVGASEPLADPEFLWSVYLRIGATEILMSPLKSAGERNCSGARNGCSTVSWSSKSATRTVIASVAAVKRRRARTSSDAKNPMMRPDADLASLTRNPRRCGAFLDGVKSSAESRVPQSAEGES